MHTCRMLLFKIHHCSFQKDAHARVPSIPASLQHAQELVGEVRDVQEGDAAALLDFHHGIGDSVETVKSVAKVGAANVSRC